MSMIVRFFYAIAAFLIGWASEGLLGEFTEEVAKEGKCVRKYRVQSSASCIQCGICMAKLQEVIDKSGLKYGGSADVRNEDIIEFMNELKEVCPAGMVEETIECTEG
ncbi:hypothetical protein [Xanthomonas euroxanthea]|uniref:hypothetical protein n=1 Tax=Xanthomonas euroxanthea TaxID=2259622 RepID=UPI00161FA136|nr:hypothetical protein [Xanthomonas euroxanthea]MBB5769422.1 hypothetical protein [Xanthomonas euroxanthea]